MNDFLLLFFFHVVMNVLLLFMKNAMNLMELTKIIVRIVFVIEVSWMNDIITKKMQSIIFVKNVY
jgi:hypothetical protein